MARQARSANADATRSTATRPTSPSTPGEPGSAAEAAELSAHADVHVAAQLLSQTLDQGHLMLRFIDHAQQIQRETLQAWDGSVNVAARQTEGAAAWDQLIAAHSELWRQGLSLWLGGEAALWSSWVELQGRLVQQVQAQAGKLMRTLSDDASRGDAADATSGAWDGANLTSGLAQGQSAMTSWMRGWSLSADPVR